MNMKKILFLGAILFASVIKTDLYPQQQVSSPMLINSTVYDHKIDSLISMMTLEEKIGQLNQLSSGLGFGPLVRDEKLSDQKKLVREGRIGSFLNAVGSELTTELQKTAMKESRLKIPLLFGLDVIHGYKATFPVPLAEACSWDTAITRMSARWQAIEAASAGIHWTFSPMVDIARDPRWGRIVEGAGEDQYLGSLIAASRVKGYQGNMSDNTSVLACAKHFAAYGAAEGGRDYNTVDMSERTLREVYLPPFKAAVDAGAATFMCSFNEIAGIPSSASRFLMTDLLRKEWGFKGMVVSDWNSIGEMINHGYASDNSEAAQLSITAGLDMDMESRAYVQSLPSLVKDKKVDVSTIDEAVRRVLKLKFVLGLFDDPYKYSNISYEKKTVLSREIRDAALQVAEKSIVLLKNEKDLLPLKSNARKIALIGPLADDSANPLGAWAQRGEAENVTTVLAGIRNAAPKGTEILYSKGCTITDPSVKGFDEAVNTAKMADVVILVVGEEAGMSGEARSRSSLELPGVQNELAKAIAGTGKPIVTVLMNGRPLAINWISENIPAIVESWFLGIRTGDAIANVLFGKTNPSGKLTVTFPRTVGQVPCYYNHKNTGRPGNVNNSYSSKYLDLPLTPLYPFGYGLSYSSFSYGKMNMSSSRLDNNSKIKISVEVKNNSEYDGEEVVQLYLQDEFASVTRPVKELKDFKKVFIPKNKSVSVEFEIDEKKLRFYNDKMEYVSEPGKFRVFVGTDSQNLQSGEFELVKN